MSVGRAAVNLPFIVQNDCKKADAKTRQLIRSHVMKGKNRVKPRSKLQPSSTTERKAFMDPSIADSLTWTPSISRLMSSKFAAIKFAAAVEPALVADVLSFASMSSKAMFLLDQCITPKTVKMEQIWFSPMLSDAAYLHAVCFTIQAYFDGFFARTRSIEAQRRDHLYYSRTIKILRERLARDDDSVRLSDSTIMTVLALSGHAYTTGDYKSANYHNAGLLKLVTMRGVDTFTQNVKLLIEIIRCDLSMAIDVGAKPLLFEYDKILWPLSELMSDYNHLLGQYQDYPKSLPNWLDSELAFVWTALSQFCNAANMAAEGRGAKISEDVFVYSMSHVMYRLLYQRFESGSLNETLRLSLLAFSSPIFLHWNRLELPDHQFTYTYRKALVSLMAIKSVIKPQERLWLIMIGIFTMAHEPDSLAWLKHWLRDEIELCHVTAWDGMRDLLSSFPWIGLVFDPVCKSVFDSVLFQLRSSTAA